MTSAVNKVRFIVVNGIFRLKKAGLLCGIIVFLIYQLIYKQEPPKPVVVEEPPDPPNIIEARKSYVNPVYKDLSSDNLQISDPCNWYFDELASHFPGTPGPDIVDLEFLQEIEFNKNIYRKKTWLRYAKRALKKELKAKGEKLTLGFNKQLHYEYNDRVTGLIEYENRMVLEINHQRVFGKCYLEPKTLNEKEDQTCTNYLRRLYPWITTGAIPEFTDWKRKSLPAGQVPVFTKKEDDGSNCYINHWKNLSNGKGIVIPLLPHHSVKVQVEHIAKLIKVLRVLKNKLPIEITYVKKLLSPSDMKYLINAARTEISGLPEAFNEYNRLVDSEHPFSTVEDYPKQDLWFVDMTSVLNKRQHPLVAKTYDYNNPAFVMSLSTIFNSFDEFVLLNQHAIPLVDDFAEVLLLNENYKKHGQLFFLNPSHLKIEKRHIIPGFHEINDLIKDFFTPNAFDSSLFGLHKRSKHSETLKVLEQKAEDIQDTTVIVINKQKHMSGLLLSCNLQVYPMLDARFRSSKTSAQGEYLWLGIESSGLNKEVYFNKNFGAAVGVLTPAENKPFNILTSSNEVCSSSWGQLDDSDDYTLLYVTSHQIENWDIEEFRNDVSQKYITRQDNSAGNKDTSQQDDNQQDNNPQGQQEHDQQEGGQDNGQDEQDTKDNQGNQDEGSNDQVQHPEANFGKRDDTGNDNEAPPEGEQVVENRDLLSRTIEKNPLYVQVSLLPAVLMHPLFDSDFKEPKNSWLQYKVGKEKGHAYWCAYDIVASPVSGTNGRIQEYGQKLQTRYNYILDVWKE